jgi:hypothetical protein
MSLSKWKREYRKAIRAAHAAGHQFVHVVVEERGSESVCDRGYQTEAEAVAALVAAGHPRYLVWREVKAEMGLVEGW